jgi:hypothetical protein
MMGSSFITILATVNDSLKLSKKLLQDRICVIIEITSDKAARIYLFRKPKNNFDPRFARKKKEREQEDKRVEGYL